MNHRTPRTFSRRRLVRTGAGITASIAAGYAHLPTATARGLTPTLQSTPEVSGPTKTVGGVLDFTLEPEGRWAGHFGSVTMRLHPGFFEGEDAWFIRTDASDKDYATAEKLVYAPLIGNALDAEGSYGNLYTFADAAEGQRPVLSTVPGQDDFTSAFRLHTVSLSGEPTLLNSVSAIEEAEKAGTVTIEQTDIIVNHPLVIWPGGGLEADPDLVAPLAGGPLVAPPDTDAGEVTFKLHQCFPGSRYIATDTSAGPMAPMMGIVPSEATQALIEVKATAPIYVFGNGLAGPAAMGFQPSIFNSKAGDPIWSPFWEHMTVMWSEEAAPIVLTSEAEVMERAEAGEVTIFKGVPESDPMSFVVNCPAPVLAPTTFDPGTFVPATPDA
jgi:hypothetical protein